MEDIIDDIAAIVSDIRTELEYPDSISFKNDVLDHCRHIDSKLCELTDAVAAIEEDEFRDMVPADISAGEAISLKKTINNWRREHGYGEL